MAIIKKKRCDYIFRLVRRRQFIFSVKTSNSENSNDGNSNIEKLCAYKIKLKRMALTLLKY